MGIIVKSRDSLLTTSSGYTNYRGILNLVIILLVLSNARAALENIIKYGILVDPISWLLFFGEGSKHWPALLIINILAIHIGIALIIEKLIAHLCYSETKFAASRQHLMYLADAGIFTNLLACISLPPMIIYTHLTHPISTSGSLMLVSIVFLKLVSYHMMNFWCRDVRREEKQQSRTTKSFLKSYTPPKVEFSTEPKLSTTKRPITPTTNGTPQSQQQKSPENNQVRQRIQSPSDTNNNKTKEKLENRLIQAKEVLAKYPENVTLDNICQFMMFPTLCYELEYARTERIRKRFLMKRVVELIILTQLDIALVQQWIVPTVSNSVLPFRQMQFSHMLERLLKLAVPNHVIWVIWFYLFFHSLLNIVAELTRFADREFYRDWWNSESVYYFWSNWNIPVHKWCARHLYVPLISLGFNKCQASTAVFFVSAFFHEYLVSVPLKMFRMWAFTGMLIQLPWARFVSAYFNNHFANVAVWVSLIIGQPLCILMYYHDYYVINHVVNKG